MSVNIQTSSGLVKIAGTPTIDTDLSNVSKNPVQNKVVTEKFNEINSNLDQLERNCRIDISYMANIGALTQNEGRYGAEIVDVRKGIYTIDFYSKGGNTYIGYKRNGEIKNTDMLLGSGRKECVLYLEDGDSLLLWHDEGYVESQISSLSVLTSAYIGYEVDKVNDSLSVIGKCKNLLNPTLQTTTLNGVTCTANGDGTIILNGTASANATFIVSQFEIQKYLGKTLRLVGCPKGGSGTTYRMFLTDNQNSNSSLTDLGEGATKTVEQWGSSEYWICYISIDSGVTVSNVVFKPMLTENLNATYDDFVPYTGDGETLTHDVAELKNDLGGLKFSTSGTTLTITDGTNTWSLSAN